VRLQGERIYLKGPEKEHIDLYLRWFNDPEILQYIMRYRPMGRIEEEEWFANLHKRPDDILYLISLNEGDRPIGNCGLHRISLPNRSAEIGIAIGEKDCWSRGYGREAMDLLCRYGFQILNLNRIGLSVYEYNERGRRCYEKIGFQLEGRRREGRYWNGRHWDILEMGLLAKEWRSRGNPKEEAKAEMCQAPQT
jgi:RimJ/RimL family protein N-acetyltransferase